MNGIICVYKEKGYTSFDVVAIMRRLCCTKKIGHGGTLDPMAEGVLPIFIGNATKAVDFCPDNSKEYRAEMRFGITTDTQDFTGKVISQSDTPVSRNMQYILKQKFTGELLQTPPMYSAVQVNGQRLYDLARKGIEVERKPRPITVYSLEFEKFGDNFATALISCSKGTYIRTLIHDMGTEAGTGAMMTALTRTRSGVFGLSDCHRLSKLKEIYEKSGKEGIKELLIPIDRLYEKLPAAHLDEIQTHLFQNGVELDSGRVIFDDEHSEIYRILSDGGVLLAIGTRAEDKLKVIQRFGVKVPDRVRRVGDKLIVDDGERKSDLKDITELKGVRLS